MRSRKCLDPDCPGSFLSQMYQHHDIPLFILSISHLSRSSCHTLVRSSDAECSRNWAYRSFLTVFPSFDSLSRTTLRSSSCLFRVRLQGFGATSPVEAFASLWRAPWGQAASVWYLILCYMYHPSVVRSSEHNTPLHSGGPAALWPTGTPTILTTLIRIHLQNLRRLVHLRMRTKSTLAVLRTGTFIAALSSVAAFI